METIFDVNNSCTERVPTGRTTCAWGFALKPPLLGLNCNCQISTEWIRLLSNRTVTGCCFWIPVIVRCLSSRMLRQRDDGCPVSVMHLSPRRQKISLNLQGILLSGITIWYPVYDISDWQSTCVKWKQQCLRHY